MYWYVVDSVNFRCTVGVVVGWLPVKCGFAGRSPFSHLSHPNPNPNSYPNITVTLNLTLDVDVDVEDRRAQAYASMPASYICELNLLILMLISNTKLGFRFQELWL